LGGKDLSVLVDDGSYYLDGFHFELLMGHSFLLKSEILK